MQLRLTLCRHTLFNSTARTKFNRSALAGTKDRSLSKLMSLDRVERIGLYATESLRSHSLSLAPLLLQSLRHQQFLRRVVVRCSQRL